MEEASFAVHGQASAGHERKIFYYVLERVREWHADLEARARTRLRFCSGPHSDLARTRKWTRYDSRSRQAAFEPVMRRDREPEVRYLTEVDGVDHFAIIALSAPDAAHRRGRSLGFARFIRSTEDPRHAEVAITVVDEAQGRGRGLRLLQTLAVLARERGVETFLMNILWGNARAQWVLRRMGAQRARVDGEVIVYTIPTAVLATLAADALSPDSESPSRPPRPPG